LKDESVVVLSRRQKDRLSSRIDGHAYTDNDGLVGHGKRCVTSAFRHTSERRHWCVGDEELDVASFDERRRRVTNLNIDAPAF
jgi:hypothetical protein